MNKKGTEKVLSLYWFAVLILVAGGIVGMVYAFYGSPYDVREIEGEILGDRIADCISDQGQISSLLIESGSFQDSFEENFLENCHLILEDREGNLEYYFEVDFYDVLNPGVSVYQISKGNIGLSANCVVQEEEEFERLAQCIENNFYSLDDSGNQYIIKILTVVRKTAENVRE